MALIDMLRRYLGPQPPRSEYEDNTPIGQPVSGAVQSYVSSYSFTGSNINPLTAMESPSVYACVRLIASSIAKLEWQILRETPEGKVVEPNHPLANLLNVEPNEDTSALVFRETLLTNALLTGNGYAYIQRDASGMPVSLELLRPDNVQMMRDGANQPYIQVYTGNYTGKDAEKKARRFRPYDVFHLCGASFEGLLGIAPIHLMRETIGLELIVQEFVTKYWANNAVPSGTLSLPGKLSPEASQRLREAWQKAHNARNAGRVAVLEDGMSYQPMASTMKDADLVAIREFCRQQIAAAFGVPAARIGSTEAQSYASAESGDAHLVKHTLSSWATRLEQEASRKLIVRGAPYCTRISFDSMLRAEMAVRFSAYNTAIMSGLMSPNECRAREGLPAVAGGESIRLPLNTAAPEPAAGGVPPAEPVSAPAEEVPASVDLAPDEVPDSVDVDPAEDEAGDNAKKLIAIRAAVDAVRPAIENAYGRHLNRVSEYLLKTRTQAKLDKWAPPIDCIAGDLRDTITGLGRIMGDEGKASDVLNAALLRHARHLRGAVGKIAALSDTVDGWKPLPSVATTELLEMLEHEIMQTPLLEGKP